MRRRSRWATYLGIVLMLASQSLKVTQLVMSMAITITAGRTTEKLVGLHSSSFRTTATKTTTDGNEVYGTSQAGIMHHLRPGRRKRQVGSRDGRSVLTRTSARRGGARGQGGRVDSQTPSNPQSRRDARRGPGGDGGIEQDPHSNHRAGLRGELIFLRGAKGRKHEGLPRGESTGVND